MDDWLPKVDNVSFLHSLARFLEDTEVLAKIVELHAHIEHLEDFHAQLLRRRLPALSANEAAP